MARWDTTDYQRMVAITPEKKALHVDFADGTSADVKYTSLPQSRDNPDWAHAHLNPFEISVPTSSGEVEIPWSTFRVLTDPEYSAHLARAAQDKAREIGTRIRQLRQTRGLSGKELASRAGITAQSLSRIENGHHDVVYRTLRRILAAMDYSLRDLIEDPVQGDEAKEQAPSKSSARS